MTEQNKTAESEKKTAKTQPPMVKLPKVVFEQIMRIIVSRPYSEVAEIVQLAEKTIEIIK